MGDMPRMMDRLYKAREDCYKSLPGTSNEKVTMLIEGQIIGLNKAIRELQQEGVKGTKE